MILFAVAMLSLGILLGANLFFAAVIVPAVFRLLPSGMARPFINSVFSLYYLFGAAISGAALALQVALPLANNLGASLLALCCGAYVLAWRELAPRVLILRDRGDSAALKRIEQAVQILNTAQMAVISALFFQTLHLARWFL